jgi:hypothetical protein
MTALACAQAVPPQKAAVSIIQGVWAMANRAAAVAAQKHARLRLW